MDGSSPFASGNLLINTLAREILASSHTIVLQCMDLFRKLGGNCFVAGRWLVAGKREMIAIGQGSAIFLGS